MAHLMRQLFIIEALRLARERLRDLKQDEIHEKISQRERKERQERLKMLSYAVGDLEAFEKNLRQQEEALRSEEIQISLYEWDHHGCAVCDDDG